MPRTPKEVVRRDGRGRLLPSTGGWWVGGLFPCGPHARRMSRKHHAFLRGWDAWEYRCPHHDPICRETKRVLKRKWWDGVRAAQGTGLYDAPANGDDYCECGCGECLEHYYREFHDERPTTTNAGREEE